MNARYVNYDDDTTPYKVTPIHAPGAATHKSMVYAIQHPITGKLMYPPQGRHWKDGQDKLLNALCEWAPYELRIIDDADVRAQICGDAVVSFQKDREMVTGGDLFMKKGGKIRKTP